MTSTMPRDACAVPPSCMFTLLMPTSGQKNVWWLRVTLIEMVSTIDDGVTEGAGVDVGKAMLMLVPGVAVATPFCARYACAVTCAMATGVPAGSAPLAVSEFA